MLCWAVHVKGGRKRYDHAAIAVGHKVYSFGGCSSSLDKIDVHVFNTVSLCWVKLPPVTRRECHLEVPSVRYGHTAVLIEDDIVYIWGGSKYMEQGCPDLYAFYVDTHRWFKPKVSGTIPEARRRHSACVLGKAMYIYGGKTMEIYEAYTDDMYKLDTTPMVWSLINTKGTPPSPSASHSAIIIGTKMFVVGGSESRGIYHDKLRVFDTETNCWLSTPLAQSLPGCSRHSAFAYNGELYIFVSDHWDWALSGLWKLKTFSWTKVKPKRKGPPSKCTCNSIRCCMYCCMVGDRIILFGGNFTPKDLYILDLNPSLKTLCKVAVFQYGLEKSELPHNIRWELAAMTTNSKKKILQVPPCPST